MELRQRAEPEVAPLTAEEKQEAAKKEFSALMDKRSGGVYVPPARLRQLQSQIVDENSKEFQRMHWEALKKSINGLINKVNVGNIKHIVPELFGENLIRGQGLFCRSIMKAQANSPPFSAIFAATVAIVNTKLPQVGLLLVKRLVVQFRKAFKRNDKTVCIASTTFLAHLVNQQVVNELLIAQALLLLLRWPTDDSVEIAVGVMKEVGQHLEQMNVQIANMIYDQLRGILHEASDLEKRTQYMIEVLFQVRRDKYKENPAVKEELDLVDEEDLITHTVDLDDDKLDTRDGLNLFKLDPDYTENEQKYAQLRSEILGDGDGSDEEGDEQSDSESEDEEEKAMTIKDQTNTDLINLRSTIYLTIKSSGGFEEAVHKLMKVDLPAGMEPELISMIVECASQERTYETFYGGIAERFCKLNRLWRELTQEAFVEYYMKPHRYDNNQVRIIAQLFGHLLGTDAIGWEVLSCIHLNEDETTSASRVFIKVLFEELLAEMGIKKLAARLHESDLQSSLGGIFPTDDPKNTRFSINFFTAIEMGRLTVRMREWLKNRPVEVPKALPQHSESESDSDTESRSSRSRSRSDRGRTRSRSDSRPRRRDSSRNRSESRSPQRNRRRKSRSYSSSSDDRSPSRSRTPPRRRDDRDSGRAGVRRDRGRNSRSPPSDDSMSRSRSGTRQARRGARNETRSPSQSRARSPPPSRHANRPNNRSVSRSISRSRSPQRRGNNRRNTSSGSSSRSRSRSPPRRR